MGFNSVFKGLIEKLKYRIKGMNYRHENETNMKKGFSLFLIKLVVSKNNTINK